jgi:CRP-like cAMP-binding protein
MKLLTGYILADLVMKRTSCHREVAAGEVVFEEGAPASGLFIVLTGRIEIVKRAGSEGDETVIAQVGPNGVFGEIGLISEGGVRTAKARAAEASLLLELRNNPIQMLRDMGETGASIQLLKRVVCVLADWLRSKNAADNLSVSSSATGPSKAAAVIQAHLPKGFFRRSAAQVRLEDGQYLCRQGDRPDGFYFIHSGVVEVLHSDDAESEERKTGEMRGPTVAGEIGYFSGEPRLASLRALGVVNFTHFPGYDFEELEEKDPEKAMEVLLAAAQSIVALVG